MCVCLSCSEKGGFFICNLSKFKYICDMEDLKKHDWNRYEPLFPEKLRAARKKRALENKNGDGKKGWSQEALGKKCGISGQSIWAVEVGYTSGMRRSNIIKIFRVLPELKKDFEENF